MKTWNLKFASYKSPDDIFNLIEDGTKTIETRPLDINSEGHYEHINVGDKLVLTSLDSGRVIKRTVKFVHTYKSISEMVNNEDPNAIFPGVETSEALLKIYEEVKFKWGSDYKYRVEHYGIAAIGI